LSPGKRGLVPLIAPPLAAIITETEERGERRDRRTILGSIISIESALAGN
jgi:hypothetical protein